MIVNVIPNPVTDEPTVSCDFSISEVVTICNALNNAQLTFIGASGMVQNGMVADFIADECDSYTSIRDKLATCAGLMPCKCCP